MKIQYCSDVHLEFPHNREYIIDNQIISSVFKELKFENNIS